MKVHAAILEFRKVASFLHKSCTWMTGFRLLADTKKFSLTLRELWTLEKPFLSPVSRFKRTIKESGLKATMARTITMLSILWASCSAQLIYPDEYERMKTSTVPPIYYSTKARPILETSSMQNSVAFAPVQSVQSTVRRIDNSTKDWDTQVAELVDRGATKFTLNVERVIALDAAKFGQRDNVVFSPLSLAVSLAMVLLGSAGRTFEEVAKVLGLDTAIVFAKNSEPVHRAFGRLLDVVRYKAVDTSGVRLDIANAIFVQNGYSIRPEYRTIVENCYKSEVLNLDFARNGGEAKNVINNWVSRKTMGKISSILMDVPSPATKVIMASALYFNGEWNQHFINGATARKTFFIEEKETITVDMMYNGGVFPFYEDSQMGVRILALPYKDSEVSMYILMPDAKGATALRTFANQLTVTTIDHLISNMKNETCVIGFPRMKLSSTLSLSQALKTLGLTSLFTPLLADLSLLSQNGQQPQPALNSVTTHAPSITQSQQTTDKPYIFSRLGGFRIRRYRRTSRSSKLNTQYDRDSYNSSQEQNPKDDRTVVVKLEENKYRFEEAPRGLRKRRETHVGLDDLRNSGNLQNPGLYADEVLHKVEIDINEKGTEAAAATSVLIERGGNIKRLLANRPFIFFIRHNPTKLLLFWGTINTPTPNYNII
ncbi:hypothetical protein KM043_008013 [Ampulex compressa]|nr:hypothetical protein KM043_008013 [Ampulex compressa]